MIASINFRCVKTAFLEALGIDQVEEVRNHIFLQSPRLRFSEKLEKVTGPTFVVARDEKDRIGTKKTGAKNT